MSNSNTSQQAEPLYRQIAATLNAYRLCTKLGNTEWEAKHLERLQELNQQMPHGSGLDSSTDLIIEESAPERLVFTSDFHHMNEDGYYDGWTEHKVIVTGSLVSGFNLKITGRDRNQIKEYLYDVWQYALGKSGDEYID